MTMLVYTVWALVLNGMGISIFKTCFSDAMEDDYGDYLLSGPPITSFIFALGVYTIVSNLTLYPSKFRRLNDPLMGLYEFLVMSFILDFTQACIWAPIDVHIYTTLTRTLCKGLVNIGLNDGAGWLLRNKFPMAILCFATSIGFFGTSLYVTRAVDYTIYTDFGPTSFIEYLKSILIRKIVEELPELHEETYDTYYPCNSRRKKTKTRKKRRKSKKYDDDLVDAYLLDDDWN